MAFGSPPAGHGSPVSRVRARLFPRAVQDEGIARWRKARAARRRHRLQRSGTAAAAVVHARELPPCCRPCSSSAFCPRPPPPSSALGGPRLPCLAVSAIVRAWRPLSSVLGRGHNPSLPRPPPTAVWVHHLPFQLSTSARILLPPLGFIHSTHIDSCRSWGRRWSLVLVLVDSCSTYLILVAAFVFGWSDLPSILCEAAIVGVCASRLTVLFSIWVMQKNEWMYWIWIQVVLYCEWTQYHWVDKSQEDGWTLLLFQSAVAILRRNKELWVFISIFAQVNFP